MSSAIAVDALPEIGLINIRGNTSAGIFNKLRNGDNAFCKTSKIPEFLSALIAKNKAINVGNIFITVSMPSLAPTKKLSNTFIFSAHP